MATITVQHTTDHNVTPEDMAQMFWDMSEWEQASFFNALGEIIVPVLSDFEGQMAAVGRCPSLTNQGRFIMLTIGSHAPKNHE